MYLRKITAVSILALSISSHAGFVSNTAHSRGNCFGFNESITWNWSEYHWWDVHSLHIDNTGSESHLVRTFMIYTWRAAALHVKEWEGPTGKRWTVKGYHFYMRNDGAVIYDVATVGIDCSGYDGWWDYPHARGE